MKTLVPYEPHLQRFPRQNMAFFPLQLTLYTQNYSLRNLSRTDDKRVTRNVEVDKLKNK